MNRLKQLRLENGYTLEQISEGTGISVEELAFYENVPIGEETEPPPDDNKRKIGF